jgi:hypothetical protein
MVYAVTLAVFACIAGLAEDVPAVLPDWLKTRTLNTPLAPSSGAVHSAELAPLLANNPTMKHGRLPPDRKTVSFRLSRETQNMTE